MRIEIHLNRAETKFLLLLLFCSLLQMDAVFRGQRWKSYSQASYQASGGWSATYTLNPATMPSRSNSRLFGKKL
ncbi:hypothetical protein GN244_ATG05682 [Phytophthora infestans]|uniref:Secreted RxLR effector peptide protein n=1 Tax=Phytophthora infestans TaxID=4787 RepID=A0A833TF58_PHYIN|nr:hypothetical protein GN244_ATG05682 [Phytophthora infestans]